MWSGIDRRRGCVIAMKQVLQSLKTGVTELADVPCPAVARGRLLVRTRATLLSSGTERMLVDFGRAGWIEKARQQPDKVRQVLDKVSTDGLLATAEAVRRKLYQPVALGYCNAGVVVEVGAGVHGLAVGDRVVSNGNHAEMVSVPQNLCARIPDSVPDEQAAFAVLGAIALQGVRLVRPTLGETVVVTGLGLIGLLTVQLLRAHGCKVVGLDFDRTRLSLANGFGASTVDLTSDTDPVGAVTAMTGGRGADAVIITASTQSSEPVHQAAAMCRKRGRVVLVGVAGLELSRADFYEKELSFQVSCSYGPGRYDPEYEDKGHDYPIGFVRWTAQRNFEAVLDMLAEQRIDVAKLISHRFAVADAQQAYELVVGAVPSLGIVLGFADDDGAVVRSRTIKVNAPPTRTPLGSGTVPAIGLIGAGNYSGGVLIPALARTGARLKAVASAGGVSGVHAARQNGIELATTDLETILTDPEIDAVVIATRHDSHGSLTVRALDAGKHVFVEKPLALTRHELDEIAVAYDSARARGRPPILMVGFNRRFSPFTVEALRLRRAVSEPISVIATVNAGAIPLSHWTQDRAVGGGRLLGEACHFVDLARHLVGAPVAGVLSVALGCKSRGVLADDRATIVIKFDDGSVATVHYLANGHSSFPKERIEIFCAGRILQIDNFRRLRGWGWRGFRGLRRWRQDKGQDACVDAFVTAIRNGGPSPIGFEELMEVSRTTLEAAESVLGPLS